MNLQAAKDFILHWLRRDLPGSLTYHSLAHTLDVYESAQEIAAQEGVNSQDQALLSTAALYHDAGFLHTYQQHEAAGCAIVRRYLPTFGYNPDQVARICGMIMATQVPQQPQNHLEAIICDADLYYLGRDDFFPVGRRLYREFLQQRVVTNEEDWNRLQVRFLEAHQYFTSTATRLRADRKVAHLQQLRRIVEGYTPSLDHTI